VEVRVALDTNRLTDLFRGDSNLTALLERCEEMWLPLFVIGEMKAGFLGGSQRQRNDALLSKLLVKERIGILLPGHETAEQFARLYVQLKRAGTPLPTNDIWIAALALEHNLTLITRDRHFEQIPQLLRG
jgi:tRNA(fMet)-specific endonuclease VapC